MIVNERLVTYINSLDRGNTPFLNQLEMDALKNQVPIIRRETQSLLKVLLRIKTPSRILEVGTAVGFSALLIFVVSSSSVWILLIYVVKTLPHDTMDLSERTFAITNCDLKR